MTTSFPNSVRRTDKKGRLEDVSSKPTHSSKFCHGKEHARFQHQGNGICSLA
ncbi:predicted protein [Pyrenophora tritici-repentis Pt-1C-BFP]|uniref:Uncharacterized protein n=1 Tax=Pyrenophora tritici-repentis (strain Pt-1C-BFP) TaxID=426418 RepID=B2W9I7_PYRTR|nr:uncharacterized protein PTRG_06645 [Pyrenophora tritici-repentis Pt-1C-BFP]EDU49565.1 predicted protein [Pyrenophora tritici-repentis Pt-1C-BFP]